MVSVSLCPCVVDYKLIKCLKPGVYGYSKEPDARNVHLPLASARALLKTINQNFGTIPFCRRYLDRLGLDKYLLGVRARL